MTSQLNPYLAFKGNAREAMDFYHSVFGGKLEMMTFKEFNMSQNPADDDKIMHSSLEADNGIMFMGGDMADGGMEYRIGTHMSMSLSGDNEEELRGYFDKLSVGGNVHEPLAKAPWGDTFGMFADKFGIEWMVNIGPKTE